MFRLFWALVAVAAVHGIEDDYEFPHENIRVQVINYKIPPEFNIFDIGNIRKNFKVIEDLTFLNEAEACRAKYPEINSTAFYEHLFCSLIVEQPKIPTAISCNMTESLKKKIQKRLFDFNVFKSLANSNVTCEIRVLRKKRTSLDLLPDGVGLIGDKQKESDLSYIFLGPSRFPVTTEIYNRFLRVNENLGDLGVLKRAVNDTKSTTQKTTKSKTKSATEKTRKKSKSSTEKSKKKSKKKTKTTKSPKASKTSKASKYKAIKLTPKNILNLMNFWKFRMVRENRKADDYVNATLYLKDLEKANEEIDDPYEEIKEHPVFYYKLFEIFFNILGRFNKYLQQFSNSTMVAGENGVSNVTTEITETNAEMEKVEQNELKREVEKKKIEMVEEEVIRQPRILFSARTKTTRLPLIYPTGG